MKRGGLWIAVLLMGVSAAVGLSGTVGAAGDNNYVITIKNNRFDPDTLTIPAGKKIRVQVKNEDPTPEEFESSDLNREKVIPGGQTGIVIIGPLKPGTYGFFGEFHPKTAQGKIVVK